LSTLNAGNPQDGNFGARVKSKPEQDAERKHLPRAIHNLEQLPKDGSHASGRVEPKVVRHSTVIIVITHLPQPSTIAPFLTGGPRGTLLSQDQFEVTHKAPQHPTISRTQKQKESGGDASADNAADALETVEAVAQRTGGSCDDDAGNEHDGRVPEAEERADGDGTATGCDEAARHEIDSGDVIGV